MPTSTQHKNQFLILILKLIRKPKKYIEENMRHHYYLKVGKNFLNRTEKCLFIKKITDKLDIIKIKNLFIKRHHEMSEKASISRRFWACN